MSRRRVMLDLAVILLVAAGAARAGGTAWYENERWGYKLRVPGDWTHAALSASEEWIASKHIGKRRLEARASEFYASDYPELWVVGFPHERTEDRGAKVETKGDTTIVGIRNPYKDYKDFLKREQWFVGGGYYFSKEEESEHGGVKVSEYEIKVEKMVNAPIRIVAWVYHFDDVDFAIQFKILEDHYDSHARTFASCLRSFRRIERTRALPGGATTGDRIVTVEDESKLTPEERAKRRKEEFNRTFQRELDALPDGWYDDASKHYVALSNTDRKFTRRALDHAEAVRAYLDKVFGDIGSGYVPPGIIRIFDSRAEEQAFQESTGGFWFGGAEQVLVTRTTGTDRSWEFEWLSSRLTDQYLSFRNSMLADNMPYWFSSGLRQHMRFARSKGRRVEIKPDEYDRANIKEIIKAGKAVPLRTLFEKGDDEPAYSLQSGSVVTYLLDRGNRGKTKGVVRAYLLNLITAIEEAQAEYDALREEQKKKAEEAAPKKKEEVEESEDEEEEDEGEDASKKSWEELREALKQKREAIRKKAFDATFGEFSDRDWERLDRAWQEYAG